MKYAHTNIVARDWRRLAAFYQQVFHCQPIPPERDLSGDWIDQATGLRGVHISGIHLRLPGHGEHGPTLEIFTYAGLHNPPPARPPVRPDLPGLGHLAFAVDDVPAAAAAVIQAGGSAVGAQIHREISGAGTITFQYLTDPEGNIIEIQQWITNQDS